MDKENAGNVLVESGLGAGRGQGGGDAVRRDVPDQSSTSCEEDMEELAENGGFWLPCKWRVRGM